MADFTKTYHRESYPAIASSAPANSQRGRTVVVSGASSGIGFAIARSFREAGADRVIILGRTQHTLDEAASQLNVEARVCDTASIEKISSLWDELRTEGVHVDVLVLSAAWTQLTTTLRTDSGHIWQAFETNVLASLEMTQRFIAQMGDKTGHALINISSFMAHSNPAPMMGSYSASKAAFATLLQHLAEEIPVGKAQFINSHPGAILSQSNRRNGGTEDQIPWDDDHLSGDSTLWLSTPAAAFLHGRFVWANWDVEELMRRKDEVMAEPGFLKIGLQGVEYVDVTKVFNRVAEKVQ